MTPTRKRRPIRVNPAALSFAVLPTPADHAAKSFCREPRMGALKREQQARLERHAQYAGTR